jgi:predicted lipid-binding transport protein (Tim44 family)
VEVIRRTWKAWNAGDMETLRDLHDPEVILRTVREWPERGPYLVAGRGHALLRATPRHLG